MNNNFSFNRVAMLLRRHVTLQRMPLMMTAAVIFGIFLLVDICIFQNTLCGGEKLINTLAAAFIITPVVLTVLGSMTFATQATKQQRIPTMLLPATKAEKFVTHFLIYFVGGTLFTLLSAALSATVCVLFSSDAEFYPGEFELTGSNVLEILFLFAAILSGPALYTLGATFWPKKSFIKTFVLLLAIQILIPTIFTLTFIGDTFSRFNYISDTELTLIVAGAYIVIALIYWLAWRKFRSWQLVQKFMMS